MIGPILSIFLHVGVKKDRIEVEKHNLPITGIKFENRSSLGTIVVGYDPKSTKEFYLWEGHN